MTPLRTRDLLLTAIAPIVWGSTYIVSTQLLPGFPPLAVAMLRALPAGLLLLAIVRQLPPAAWLGRVLILGALNFAVFWSMLFVSAYRLPGGVAATVGAIQPLAVVFLSSALLGTPLRARSVAAALMGLAGVALLVLRSGAALDLVGVAAGMAGALSMGLGTVLTRKWHPPVSPLTFAAWQLTAGGLLLVPAALLSGQGVPVPTAGNLLGLGWIGLVGAALTSFLMFRGIARLGPAATAMLGLLSPATAVLLGWVLLGEALRPLQIVGALIVLASIWLGQRAGKS